MGTLKVNSKSMQTTATYTDDAYKVELNYTTDVTSHTLKTVNGTIYKDENATYAGNFSGNVNGDGEISYSFSGIKTSDMSAVTTMIIDIENKINSEK